MIFSWLTVKCSQMTCNCKKQFVLSKKSGAEKERFTTNCIYLPGVIFYLYFCIIFYKFMRIWHWISGWLTFRFQDLSKMGCRGNSRMCLKYIEVRGSQFASGKVEADKIAIETWEGDIYKTWIGVLWKSLSTYGYVYSKIPERMAPPYFSRQCN